MMNPPSRADLRPLVEKHGREIAIDAPFNGFAWLGKPETAHLLAASGDGAVRTFAPDLALVEKRQVHTGAILALATTRDGTTLVTGGDDGLVARMSALGGIEEVARTGKGRWADAVAVGNGADVAWSEGRKAVVVRNGARRELEHAATVAGLAFDDQGRRLACAHYNGASVWALDDKAGASAKPQMLGWKGSHLAVRFAPGGRFLVTVMQENSLHGWRLADGANMRMAGYPTRPKSLSFARNGQWMASSGAEGVVLWPFKDKDGPMGKSGEVLAPRPSVVTAVAFHPESDVVLAGYSDGCVVMTRRGQTALVVVRRPKPGVIAAVAWSAGGQHVAYATEGGIIGAVDLMRTV